MEKILKRTKVASGKFLDIFGIEIDFGNNKKAVFERMEFNNGELLRNNITKCKSSGGQNKKNISKN